MSLLKSTRNQIINTGNQCQGEALKVLCVCSAGLLRSPTLANMLNEKYGLNTRAVGSAKEFALTPMSESHVVWADYIVFVDEDCKDYLSVEDWEFINEWGTGKDVITLNVPDDFNYDDPVLREILFGQWTSQDV